MQTLNETVNETFVNSKIREAIRGCALIIEFESANNLSTIDKIVIDEMKAFYNDLDLYQLLLVWHDNYHSFRIVKGKGIDNAISYLVKHKVVALGTIINEKYS